MRPPWLAGVATTLSLNAGLVCSHISSTKSQELPAEHMKRQADYNIIPHLPDQCSDIRIFNARGSDEPYPGRGGAMLGTICSMFESNGVSCDYEDIVYPANISYSGIYCESAYQGALAGQAQMEDFATYCPDSRIVLMGYSQGGEVVGDIVGGGGGQVFGCEQPESPPMARNTTPGSTIAAIVSFGSPRFTAGQPYNIGRGSNFSGVSARQRQQLADLNKYEDILAMWCNAGDPVCAVGSDPVNITAHWSYYEEYSEVASRWIVATALNHEGVRLDLDLDGQDESIDLTGTKTSNNSSRSSAHDTSNLCPSSRLLGLETVWILSLIAVVWTIGIPYC